MINNIMTLKEAAQFLKVAPVTLYRKARDGTVPASRLGRSWRFHREQLEEWIKNPPPAGELTSPASPSFRHLSTRETESVFEFTKAIRQEGHIEKIILYGSRARGDFSENSDIDLLVVLNAKNPSLKKSIVEQARELSYRAGIVLQVLVLAKSEWENPSFKTFLLIEKINQEGMTLYE